MAMAADCSSLTIAPAQSEKKKKRKAIRGTVSTQKIGACQAGYLSPSLGVEVVIYFQPLMLQIIWQRDINGSTSGLVNLSAYRQISETHTLLDSIW